jgi:hypothetical protein
MTTAASAKANPTSTASRAAVPEFGISDPDAPRNPTNIAVIVQAHRNGPP